MIARIVSLALLLAACRTTPEPPAEHRPEGAVCESGRATWTVEPVGAYGPESTCADHPDCTDGDDGRCTLQQGREGSWLQCTYTECLTDDDCDGVCECAGEGEQAHSTCLPPGDCKVDADCGNEFCSPSVGDCGPGWGPVRYFCHTGQDECRDSSDCGGNDYCAFDEAEEHWVCSNAQCVG